MVEYLFSIYKTPGSNRSTTKKEEGRKEGGDEEKVTMEKKTKKIFKFVYEREL